MVTCFVGYSHSIMVFMEAYESLARSKKVSTLVKLSFLDERVYDVVARHQLGDDVAALLPDPHAARFLARGICYSEINDVAMQNVVTIASRLARYTKVSEGSALAELLGNLSIPEAHRMELFNFSEQLHSMRLWN